MPGSSGARVTKKRWPQAKTKPCFKGLDVKPGVPLALATGHPARAWRGSWQAKHQQIRDATQGLRRELSVCNSKLVIYAQRRVQGVIEGIGTAQAYDTVLVITGRCVACYLDAPGFLARTRP